MMTIEILRQTLQAVGPTAAMRARLRSRAQAIWSAIAEASARDAIGPLMQLSIRRERTDPLLAEQLRLAAADLAAGAHRAQEIY